MIPFGAGALFRRRQSNPFPDHAWRFLNTIPASGIPADQANFPIPQRVTVPGLHETGEVLKLPLRKSVSAFGRDDYGLWDYSYSLAKTSPTVPTIFTPHGSGYSDVDGYHSSAQADYGSVPNSTDNDLSTTDFTMELWIYTTAPASTDNNLVAKRQQFTLNGWQLYIEGAGSRLGFGGWLGSAKWSLLLGSVVARNEWHHIAVTRSGSSWKLWLDGALDASATDANPLYNYAGNLTFFASNNVGSEGAGYGIMSDFRLCKAVLYTDTFTPPARGSMVLPQDLFVYNPAEVLNLPLTGHTTDLGFGTSKDTPETAHTPSVNSGTIGAGGLALAGGNYLAYPHSADFMNGTVDFYKRIEVTFSALPASSGGGAGTGQYMPLFDKGGNDQTFHLVNNFYGENGVKFRMRDVSNNTIIELQQTGAFDYSTGVRYTFEIIRNGTAATIKRNGVQIAAYTITNVNAHADANDTMRFGYNYDAAGGMVNLNATIHSILFLKGTATAPAATYQYAGQDARIAQGATEVPTQTPLRGFNPISGVWDAFIMPDALSSSADNEFEVYIGNADAEPTTETDITYPAAYPEDPNSATYPDDFDLDQLTDDQETILNAAYNSPATFQTIGELEANE